MTNSFKVKTYLIPIGLIILFLAATSFYAIRADNMDVNDKMSQATHKEALYLFQNLNDRLDFLGRALLSEFTDHHPRNRDEYLHHTEHMTKANPFIQSINYIDGSRTIK
jgi:phytoene/squalene synthetase